MVTPADFHHALLALGLLPGDHIMVHTSFRSFGGFVGGPERLIEELRLTVGKQGLVAFPSFTGTYLDGPSQPPVLDVPNTVSAFWVGAVPELARRRADAVRSLDPTHSLALFGAPAQQLAQAHLQAPTPCGIDSPFVWLAAQRGYVLLIGADYNSMTLVHTAEELAEVPYHLHSAVTQCRVIDAAGNEHIVKRRLHEWVKPPLDFNRLVPTVQAAGGERELRCGGARLRLVNAEILLAVALPILRREPLFLLA